MLLVQILADVPGQMVRHKTLQMRAGFGAAQLAPLPLAVVPQLRLLGEAQVIHGVKGAAHAVLAEHGLQPLFLPRQHLVVPQAAQRIQSGCSPVEGNGCVLAVPAHDAGIKHCAVLASHGKDLIIP